MNYQKDTNDIEVINFTKSNALNNFGIIKNKKEKTELSNLILKFKNFELGYQKSGDIDFDSDKVFFGYN